MTTYPEVALAWIDVETSDLDPHAPSALLLQVACLVTDLDLNVLDDSGFESLIHHSDDALARARQAAEPFVQEMHDDTGLWQACADPTRARSRTQVEVELATYIKGFAPAPRTARLAGNSVRLDLNFLDRFLPDVTAHLHYRMLDVSSIAGAAHWWGGVDPFPKQRAHTAMADIRESLAEMRYLRGHLFPPPSMTPP